ncbi:ammonium transporter [Gammaproteobacteria bacterium]|nr:ammonium transporter [Gammaproteobacteria bacterium]MDC3386453.1 ammonium transporter [Gammaproteobacteria bacterium]
MDGQLIELAYALDTFYFLVMGAFVMWMAAGFSMLEAGLVRSKSTVEILTKNIALYSIASIMYMLVGYNLMYPADGNGIIPAVSFFLGGDNEAADVIASGGEVYYSALSDFFFQVVFVATAMSIVSGAVAERMKLSSFLLFCVVMTGLIYPIQGYWKWGGGFLDAAGFQDFAGSGVVHLCGAAAALAGVFLLGARKGKYVNGKINAIPGANMPLATLGTFILWLGWFGFNGGSELMMSNVAEANAVALIFVNTNAAAAGGVIGALLFSKILFGKFDLSMSLNGAIGGLVSITAEPLAPTPELAAIIGAVGGILVVISIIVLDKSRIDDPVGAISAHGTCGIWGLIAVTLSNGDATLGAQLYGTIVIFAWTFIMALIFWGILKMVIGIRVSEEAEEMGVDVAECGMEAYPEFKK